MSKTCVIMKITCSPSYHHNDFAATCTWAHDVGNRTLCIQVHEWETYHIQKRLFFDITCHCFLLLFYWKKYKIITIYSYIYKLCVLNYCRAIWKSWKFKKNTLENFWNLHCIKRVLDRSVGLAIDKLLRKSSENTLYMLNLIFNSFFQLLSLFKLHFLFTRFDSLSQWWSEC